tara:strand:+ start:3127 stop:3549 length:423 start_codon:yes stop_codon:yes gene_type:complete
MKIINDYLNEKETSDKFQILEAIMLKETFSSLILSTVKTIILGTITLGSLHYLSKKAYKKYVLKKLHKDTCINIEPKFRKQCRAHIKAKGGEEALKILNNIRYKCNQSKKPEKCFKLVDKAIDQWEKKTDPKAYYQKIYS